MNRNLDMRIKDFKYAVRTGNDKNAIFKHMEKNISQDFSEK